MGQPGPGAAREKFDELTSFGVLEFGVPYSIYIKVTVCNYVPTYVPLSQENRRTNLHQILHRPPHQPRDGS